MKEKNYIQDTTGRSFKTLRVSLLPFCNLGCVYCVNGKDESASSKVPLSYSHLLQIIEVLHDKLSFRKIRLTGGEPTLYHDLVPLSKGLSTLKETTLCMTTNGVRLQPFLQRLFENNLRSLNISLDAIDENVFRKISARSGVNKILTTIEEAVAIGFEVKLNAVILRGINDEEIIPLTEFARKNNSSIRFLELMKMGHLFSKDFERYFISRKEITDQLNEHYSLLPELRKASATAEYWQLEEGGRVGVIANETAPFCHDCDRLRLDSFGDIYGCLSSDVAIAIHDSLNNEDVLRRKLMSALEQKQELNFTGSKMSMLHIGG